MKKVIFTISFFAFYGLALFAQTESYTALKVTGNNIPVIDGVIEPLWDNVEKVTLAKVPEIGGVPHPNITVPNPDPSDYSAEIGMVWNDDGIFFWFKVVDELLVIEDDYYMNNGVDADQWWTDDNINILFSKDLVNASFQQWEFAWQPGIDQEEKLSSDLWANPAVIDESLVSSAWFNDGTTWILETFIDWGAFADGNANISDGMDIYLEARARDDDDGGTWESMFHWSTINYEVENDGVGMGTVTLSGTELEVSGIFDIQKVNNISRIYPNPSNGYSDLELTLDNAGDVYVSIFDLAGKKMLEFAYENMAAGNNIVPLNLATIEKGIYMVHVQTKDTSGVAKLFKQ